MKLTHTNQINNNINKLLSHNNIILDNKSVCVMLSGGPDSLSLLYLLIQNKKINLSAAYVQHSLRNSRISKKETIFIEQLCSKLDIKLYKLILDKNILKNSAKSSNKSVEEAARLLRYNFSKNISDKNKIDYFATGHNADENRETVVMRFFQGSSVQGLKGIPFSRDNFIRPLLTTNKSLLLEFLKQNKIKYLHDKSNKKNDIYRNKIRNIVIPTVKKNIQSFDKSIDTIIEKMNNIDNHLNSIDYSTILIESKNKIKISIIDIKILNRVIQEELIFHIFNKLGVNERIPHSFIKELLYLNFDKINRFGLSIYIDNGYVIFSKTELVEDFFIPIENFGNYSFLNYNIKVISSQTCPNNDDLWFDAEKVQFPLFVRGVRVGDKIATLQGEKLLLELLNKMKLNKELKKNLPILCDKFQIIGILGKVVDRENRISTQYKTKKANNYIIISIREET